MTHSPDMVTRAVNYTSCGMNPAHHRKEELALSKEPPTRTMHCGAICSTGHFRNLPTICSALRRLSMTLNDHLKERILVLDGAMGTMIQNLGLSEADYRDAELENHPSPLFGNSDLLNLTQPNAIQGIHEAFLAAGADIVSTNTFTATTAIPTAITTSAAATATVTSRDVGSEQSTPESD